MERIILWRESEYFRELPFPSVNIVRLQHRDSINAGGVSKKTGIPRCHISEMENGKRLVG